MKFRATMDFQFRLITSLVSLLFIIIFLRQCYLIFTKGLQLSSILVIVFLIVAYVGFYINRVVSYLVTNESITIVRPLKYKNVIINRKNIAEANIVNGKDTHFSLRRLGFGGVFGYHGVFTNYKLGSVNLYLTRADRLVLIKTVNNLVVFVFPDDADGFLSAITI